MAKLSLDDAAERLYDVFGDVRGLTTRSATWAGPGEDPLLAGEPAAGRAS